MARSKWKGPYVEPSVKRKLKYRQSLIDNENRGYFLKIRSWSRRSTILPEHVGVLFRVHNGKDLVKLTVTEEMVGSKLGAFVPTKVHAVYGDKKKKKKR